MVREPLLWLGLADPVASQSLTKMDDPERSKFLAVADQWWALFGDSPKNTIQVRQVAEEKYQIADSDKSLLKNRHFHDSLLEVAEKRGKIDGGRLGMWLKQNKGRRYDGYRFEQMEESFSNAKVTRNNRWRLTGGEAQAGLL
jgi:putative DNA primase/helicase